MRRDGANQSPISQTRCEVKLKSLPRVGGNPPKAEGFKILSLFTDGFATLYKMPGVIRSKIAGFNRELAIGEQALNLSAFRRTVNREL